MPLLKYYATLSQIPDIRFLLIRAEILEIRQNVRGGLMYKINFSGHPVAGYDCAPLIGVNLPVDSGVELIKAVSTVLEDLPMAENLKHGLAAEIILPGMAQASGVLLALWHGRFGTFPTFRWAVRGSDGFGWPEAARVDLQELRLQARTSR